MYEYGYTVLFDPAEEGGFVATCPALPGLVTEGDTLDEAREMVQDAIRTYLESVQKDGLPIPNDFKLSDDTVKDKIRVVMPERDVVVPQTQGCYPSPYNEAGFFIHYTSGSHYILKHPSKPDLRVTIASRNKELKRRTLASIIDQAGFSPEEFLDLL